MDDTNAAAATITSTPDGEVLCTEVGVIQIDDTVRKSTNIAPA